VVIVGMFLEMRLQLFDVRCKQRNLHLG